MAKPKSAIVNIKAATIHPDGGGEALTTKPAKPEHITDDWDAKDHLSTIAKAHAIMMDPVKMKKVSDLAGFHKKAIRSTKDISDYAQQKYGGVGGMPKGEPDESEGMES